METLEVDGNADAKGREMSPIRHSTLCKSMKIHVKGLYKKLLLLRLQPVEELLVNVIACQ
jgi:hypothetical protein